MWGSSRRKDAKRRASRWGAAKLESYLFHSPVRRIGLCFCAAIRSTSDPAPVAEAGGEDFVTAHGLPAVDGGQVGLVHDFRNVVADLQQDAAKATGRFLRARFVVRRRHAGDRCEDAVKVTDEQAARMARWLVEKDGIFVGSSSAVNCVAAVVTAMKLPPESRVVTLLCDSGTRHLSKFWKVIGDMGLEKGEVEDLFAALGIEEK